MANFFISLDRQKVDASGGDGSMSYSPSHGQEVRLVRVEQTFRRISDRCGDGFELCVIDPVLSDISSQRGTLGDVRLVNAITQL